MTNGRTGLWPASCMLPDAVPALLQVNVLVAVSIYARAGWTYKHTHNQYVASSVLCSHITEGVAKNGMSHLNRHLLRCVTSSSSSTLGKFNFLHERYALCALAGTCGNFRADARQNGSFEVAFKMLYPI